MGQIIYQIVAGTPNFTASLNSILVPSQVHTALGVYSFDNIAEGTYILTVVDSLGCSIQREVNTLSGTTTRYVGCDLVGIAIEIDCALTGIAVVSVPPPCQREAELNLFSLISQYEVTSPWEVVITSASSQDACAGAAYMASFEGEYLVVAFTGLDIYTSSLFIGSVCYLSNGTDDCTFPPNGWYYTELTAASNTIFNIVDGIIVEIIDCSLTTTTTSTISTTTTTTTTADLVPCGVQASYQGYESYPEVRTNSLGSEIGEVVLNYNTYSIPDLFILEFDSAVVINTGYRGNLMYDLTGGSRSAFTNSLLGRVDPVLGGTYPNFTNYIGDGYPRVEGTGIGTASFYKGTATITVTIKVYAPMEGTAWLYLLDCPVATTTTTTSSSTTTTSTTEMPTTTTTSTSTEAPVTTTTSTTVEETTSTTSTSSTTTTTTTLEPTTTTTTTILP